MNKNSSSTTPLASRPHLIQRCSISLIACAVLWSAAPTSAQNNWETVCTVDAARVEAVAADGAGNIFSAGAVVIDPLTGQENAVVVKSSDGGTTWDRASFPLAEDLSHITALTASPGKVLMTAIVAGRWIVCQSTDAGNSWQKIDDFSGYYSNQPWAIAVDGPGNLYVVGVVEERLFQKGRVTTVVSWLVRKGTRTPAGYNWTNVSKIAGGGAVAVACVGTNVFVAGSIEHYWDVRKSSDGGSTWTLVDHYRELSHRQSNPQAIVADRSGNVLVTGFVDKPRRTCIVRQGNGVGAKSFRTIDEFYIPRADGTGSAMGLGIAIDKNGTVHLTGSTSVPGTIEGRWFAREGRVTGPGTWSWTTTDLFEGGYLNTLGVKVTADPTTGHVFSVGRGSNLDEAGDYWIVRRKLASPTP